METHPRHVPPRDVRATRSRLSAGEIHKGLGSFLRRAYRNAIRTIRDRKPADIPPIHEGRTFPAGGEPRGNGGRHQMRKSFIAVIGSTALVLAMVLAISPHATTIANEASVVPGIDILDLTKNAGALPEQYFPAF
jgi:hypothetical protein